VLIRFTGHDEFYLFTTRSLAALSSPPREWGLCSILDVQTLRAPRPRVCDPTAGGPNPAEVQVPWTRRCCSDRVGSDRDNGRDPAGAVSPVLGWDAELANRQRPRGEAPRRARAPQLRRRLGRDFATRITLPNGF